MWIFNPLDLSGLKNLLLQVEDQRRQFVKSKQTRTYVIPARFEPESSFSGVAYDFDLNESVNVEKRESRFRLKSLPE